MADKTAPSLLPKINPKLPKAVRIKAQLVFYKRLVQVTAWSLRYDYGLYFDQEPNVNDDKHAQWAWEDLMFQVRYSVLMKLSDVGSFYRWQPYLQEFVFYNTVGYRRAPFSDIPNENPGYSIDEDSDLLGKFVYLKIYTEQSDASWRRIQRDANKRLRNYERKWEWNGADLELIAQVANLHRIEAKLTSSDIAGRIEHDFPELAKKTNGYNDDDIKKILANAKKLGY